MRRGKPNTSAIPVSASHSFSAESGLSAFSSLLLIEPPPSTLIFVHARRRPLVCYHDPAKGAVGLCASRRSPCANELLVQSMLNCIDNSGAAIVECVKVLKMKRHAKVGMFSRA